MCTIRGLMVIAVVVMLACGAHAKNLYPECSGSEKRVSAKAGGTSTLMSPPLTEGNVFTISCFAYEVATVRGNQKDPSVDYCKVAHQTEYPYSLYVKAVYDDDDGNQQSQLFSLRDISGSSIDGIKVHMNHTSKFSIEFANAAESPDCELSIRALLTYSVRTAKTTESMQYGYVPTVVAVRPTTVHPKQAMTMVLQFPEGVDEKQRRRDRAFLVPLKERCWSPIAVSTMDTGVMPASFEPLDHKAVYSPRSKRIDESGSFRVCYENSGKVYPAVEVAVVSAFSSNPAYYDVVKGADGQGRVTTHAPITIKFFGADLDTRPKGDKAKLVDDEDTCRAGKPAGGVPMGTDLGPADNYGSNTTYSLWDITIRYEGLFKLCYQRAGEEDWSEVPYISMVEPGAGDAQDGSTPAPVPIPKNEETGAACPMAPPAKPGQPWVKYKSVKLVMLTKEPLAALTGTIQKLFCVPRSAFAVTRVTHNKDNEQVVHFSFLCDNLTDKEQRLVCDSTERANYAVYLGTLRISLLQQFNIKSLVGSTSMATSGEDPSTIVQRGGSALGTLFICVTVLCVAAVVAYTVMKYREKRQYMVQFGMDDDDIDEMYTTGAIPTAGAMGSSLASNYNSQPAPQTSQHHHENDRGAGPRGAVIEIED